MEKYNWHTIERTEPPIMNGDLRVVTLPVKVVFEWSDKIVADYDSETGHTEYTSGYVMQVLPNQTFVYNNEMSTLLGSVFKAEKP